MTSIVFRRAALQNAFQGLSALSKRYQHRSRPSSVDGRISPRRRSSARVAEDFLAKLKRNSNGCLEWTGGKTQRGYGSITFWNITVRTSQFAFAIFWGHPATGCVLHHCDNPICCDPSHLFDGSHLDNMRDRLQKGRYDTVPRGMAVNTAKLTPDQVLAMRGMFGKKTDTQLASEFRITPSAVRLIRIGRNWKHI